MKPLRGNSSKSEGAPRQRGDVICIAAAGEHLNIARKILPYFILSKCSESFGICYQTDKGLLIEI